MEPPKGPARQIMGGASEFYGIWKFAKNKEARDRVPQILRRQLAGSLQGERRVQQPVLRQSRAEADADPVERSDLDAARQARDPAGLGRVVRHLPAIRGRPGPPIDEIYNDFIISDMMAKTATGQLSAEDSVKWATQQCEAIFKKWAGKT